MLYHSIFVILNMSWPNFIQRGKISIRFLLPILILCGCFLFLPDAYKKSLHIDGLSDQYSVYFGPAFLITSVLILLDAILFIYNSIKDKITQIRINAYVEDWINKLSPLEKSVMREFLLSGNDTIPLPYNDPVVEGLVSKRIIKRVSDAGNIIRNDITFNYTFTEYAINHLTPEKIDIPLNPTDREKQTLIETRPHWAKGYM